MDDEQPEPRFASRGRAYVYLLPCRDADVAKVGFSRDPLDRLRSLHRRFFEFFDLERAALVETATVRESRALERRLIESLADCRASAPLVVREVAGGYTEWHAGATGRALEIMTRAVAERGHALHAPLSRWLRARLAEQAAMLYQWSAKMLEAAEYERHHAPPGAPGDSVARALRETLDAYLALGIEVEPRVPGSVWRWYVFG